VAPYRFRLLEPKAPEAELAFVQQRLKDRPDSALDLATLAGLHLRLRKFDDAEKAARRSLELLPAFNSGASLVLAHIAQARHDFAEAIRLAQDVLKDRMRHPDALSILVTANLGFGRVQEAVRWADQLADRMPTTANLTQRAVALEAVGRDDEALHDYLRAIDVEDIGEMEASSRARTMLARFHARRGRTDDAQDLLREAIRIHPQNHVALALLGDIVRPDSPIDAERHYTSALQASGGEPAYLMKKGLREQAEKMLRDELATSTFGHRRTLAELLLQTGRNDEALALMLEESKNRRDVETLELLADALLRSGRAKDAQTVLREALATGVKSASLWTRAAAVERKLNNPSRAKLYERLATEVRG
jgi:tetratricopeptide (TPR) repeat protein